MVKGSKMSIQSRQKMRIAKIGCVPWNKGLKYSSEMKSRLNMSGLVLGFGWSKGKNNPKLCGENNPAWKGGVTKKNDLIRRSSKMGDWRKSVFERDNYTCQDCGIKSSKGVKAFLHADHIKPFAYFIELRFDINNGRTLCVDCHRKTPTWGENAKSYAR